MERGDADNTVSMVTVRVSPSSFVLAQQPSCHLGRVTLGGDVTLAAVEGRDEDDAVALLKLRGRGTEQLPVSVIHQNQYARPHRVPLHEELWPLLQPPCVTTGTRHLDLLAHVGEFERERNTKLGAESSTDSHSARRCVLSP